MNTIGEKMKTRQLNKQKIFQVSSISNLQFYLYTHTKKPRTRLEGISIKANTDMMREK